MQATDRVNEDDPDLFIDDEAPSEGAPVVDELAPWRILIVDDDVDVHVVTKFALSNTHFQGRRLSFLHAYSGKEALEKLRDTPDIALVLLDVMMETADAGLLFARKVREELHNDLVRIVLRTGQPGQALEHSIIVDYDINDFWSKADLTTRKLFTTVIAALRAYTTLANAAHARDAALAELQRARQILNEVGERALVLTLDREGRIVDANPHFCQVAGQPLERLRGRDLHAVHREAFPPEIAAEILSELSSTGAWSGTLRTDVAGVSRQLHCSIKAYKGADGTVEQYVAVATEPG
ncbi:PAS domain-containing protein [Massilia sp. R2A-15]|uniref:PAS domain-containing protein n=1 Tax=Massilia sp. R2A-15 TaxID=3064278 RepID=UPI00273321C7|nr:PAS domain-containing protein [Massilia sp. R2A-15]WLI91576.1 PAS domain-containing protein [Massilia sp. R2A-15]